MNFYRTYVTIAVGFAITPSASSDELDPLITRYFQSEAPKDHDQLVLAIEKAAEGLIARVADAVRNVQLWEPLPAAGVFDVPTRSAGTIKVWWRGFIDPDPTPPRGLVLVMPDADEVGNHDLAHNRAIASLGPAFYNECFVAALEKPIAGDFHQHSSAGDDLRVILRELRRRLHFDSDRVFLFGSRDGGQGAWTAALFHPDLFAGVITVASHPRLPYAQQLAPLLLPNLGRLPVLSIWQCDAGDAPEAKVLAAALYNRAIAQFAQQNDLPIRSLETSFAPTEYGLLPDHTQIENDLRTFAQHRRAAPGQKIIRWFRYPAQGDLGWLRAAKLHGDVWTDDQLSMVTAPAIDPDKYITDFFQDKLFQLSGQITGQTVTIDTKGVSKLEVRFYEGMIDFTQPVTIICNGRRRFEGLIKPSVSTLLENAHGNWDFQRLTFATMSFSIRADGAND